MTKLNKEPSRANDGYTQEFIKAKVNENGKPGVWAPLGDKAFWTSESMKLANMSEIIEGMEGDSLVTRELLQELGRLAIVGAESEKPELGKPYYYGDPGKYKSGDTVYGYYFKKYRPDKTQKYYEELFNPQAEDALLTNEKGPNSVAIEKALEDEVRARTEGQLIYHSDNPEIGLEEYQKELARYYVGPLNYSRLEQNKYKEKGKFSNFGANRYSLNHADSVEYAKSKFFSSTENDTLGKMFEGFFYPLVRCGFFDLRGQNRDGAIPPSQYGAAIVPSEYDDIYKNKVDFAAVVPMVVEGGEGEKTLVHQPISFALTVGTDFRKADKIKKEFFSKKGLSEMEYPSTCLGNAIPPMKNIPYFVIRLEKKTELNSYMKSLTEGRVPTREIRRVIYFQIYRQAKHWANYWENRRDLDNYPAAKDNTIRQFKRIAGWSLRRMDMAPDAREKVIQKLVRDHPQLTYLDKL